MGHFITAAKKGPLPNNGLDVRPFLNSLREKDDVKVYLNSHREMDYWGWVSGPLSIVSVVATCVVTPAILVFFTQPSSSTSIPLSQYPQPGRGTGLETRPIILLPQDRPSETARDEQSDLLVLRGRPQWVRHRVPLWRSYIRLEKRPKYRNLWSCATYATGRGERLTELKVCKSRKSGAVAFTLALGMENVWLSGLEIHPDDLELVRVSLGAFAARQLLVCCP
jgi:hypothetical protein